jgi:uncharacterized protein (TIGR02099 family)
VRLDIMRSSTAVLRWIGRSSLLTTRALLWCVTALALAVALLVLGLRYWILPNIDTHRERIAAAVSRAADAPITIGRISGNWDGLRPRLTLEGVRVLDATGRPALELARVESTLSWRTLTALRLHFHALDIFGPRLEVHRDAEGSVRIAGLPVDTGGVEQGGFGRWLFAQREVEVHDATVTWSDALRNAPPLTLTGLTLQLRSRGNRHRFGLRAVPPAALAGPLDIRGDLRGRSLHTFADLNGKLFLKVDYVDIAAWRPWLDVPLEVSRGAGGVRAWLTYRDDALTELVADVGLREVRVRLRRDLPALELRALAGRLTWKGLSGGFELVAARLGLESGGKTLAPADLRVRLTRERGVDRGEIQAAALELAPLVVIADRLPLEAAMRRELLALSPRGSVSDFTLRWRGAWTRPEQWNARGRFQEFASAPLGGIPGVSGLSGHFEASEKSGTLHLNAQRAVLVAPQVFEQPLAIDALGALVAWNRTPSGLEVKFSNVTLANADLAGTLSGSYRTLPQGPGEIDLTAALTRADARRVSHYLPRQVPANPRRWLEQAFMTGEASDVRLRLKGPLGEFPFVSEERGLFHVTARVRGGTLHYAAGWPDIRNIEGELTFRGARMLMDARQGVLAGVRLERVKAEIPNLAATPATLHVAGEAEGQTGDFLAFVAATPVGDRIERLADGVKVRGAGRLALKLAIPLSRPAETSLVGHYQFTQNDWVIDSALPAFEQASGRIEFSESAVRAPSVTGSFLGSPLSLSAQSQGDSTVRVELKGRAEVDKLRAAGGPDWLKHLRGATDWRGSLTLRRRVAHIALESDLVGVAARLPAPFGKEAATPLPVRLERRIADAGEERLSIAYGGLVRAELARRGESRDAPVERGMVQLGGGAAALPDRPGLWVRGSLTHFDLDEWLQWAGSEAGENRVGMAGMDVRFGAVDVLGRRFRDLAVRTVTKGEAVHVELSGPDIEGSAVWRSAGAGSIGARLTRLALPAAETRATAAPRATERSGELPALDLRVDEFRLGDKPLGALEVRALHRFRDWRIERLRLASPESVLTAEGVWQSWRTEPRTELNVRMDVTDIGQTLARWGYPPGVRRGNARIEGRLGWAGSPQQFDYPTLAGELVLQAEKGEFVKLEPGIAKLLGILSLQALPRRIALDFRDIFSEGLAFDSIRALLKIDRGVATTEALRIESPSARVLMSGEVDLARETQKLRVRVSPHVAEGVSIAGALLGGPVAGIATYLAQKLLRDPLEQLISYEYRVTGTWNEPQVARVDRAPAPAAAGVP